MQSNIQQWKSCGLKCSTENKDLKYICQVALPDILKVHIHLCKIPLQL